ncbi:MAG: (2Fe-2S) ferredoxin domain-containing protein [Armatimonadota bacterium]
MLEVKVCVGSSCHIRGGATTLKILKSLIEAHGLTDKVDLCADLCLDGCVRPPNVVVAGIIYGGVGPDTAEEFFREHILPEVD